MRPLDLAVLATVLLVIGGCASRSDLDVLRSQVASLRGRVDAVEDRANQAQAQSAEAQNDAAIARQQYDALLRRMSSR
jgi:outer membrane murein-binding lipoprotein Lpp